MLKFTAIVLFLLICFDITSYAQLTVTPATNTGCEGANILLNDIIISEGGGLLDFGISSTPQTLRFNLSAGTFNNLAGTAMYSVAGVSYSLNVQNSYFEVTLTETAPGHESSGTDVLTISGIEVSIIGTIPQTVSYDNVASTLPVVGWIGGEIVANFQANPLPFGTNDVQTVCSNSSTLNYDLANNVFTASGINSTISFTSSADPGITGNTPGGTVPTLTDNLVNSNATAGNVVYTVTPTSIATGCVGTSFTLTVAVNPDPDFSSTLSPPTICSGGTFNYTATSSVAGATFSWSRAVVSGISEGATSGTGNVNEILTNTFGTPVNVTYAYTVTANGCTNPSTFNVNVTVDPQPTTAVAGIDQAICGTNTTLGGNTPGVGTGTWSIISGTGGVISNAPDPASPFSGTAGVSYTLRWTISNGVCTSSFDDVLITFDQPPTVSVAGTDQTICGTNTTLGGNTPVVGTGTWSIISGAGGVISNSPDPASPFSGTAGFSYTLRWTISNGSCTSSFDEVLITFDQPPTISIAGTDQSICGTATTLSGNNPTVGTGTWSIISGAGGVISNAPDPTSPFSGTAGFSYTLRWTISNGGCASSNDDVLITFNQSPTVSIAGADQSICGTNTILGGNNPTVGTGTWSIISGAGGVISNAPDPASPFSGTAGVSYTLRWTISNGSCTPSFDDVLIIFNQPPTVSIAGTDQSICGTATTLSGSNPTVGTGTWSIISGAGGVISNAPDPTSPFSGTAGFSYTLRWTISNGGCASSNDDVLITFNQSPTVSIAGADQSICGTNTILGGNNSTVGTGTWSIISGTGGVISNSPDPTSPFSGTAGISYTLRWTITSAGCPSSFDDVLITFDQAPTIASAGTDQTICGIATTLTGNNPSIGFGTWSIIGGAGGELISNALDPASSFSGIAGSSNSLRWTISNGSCPASSDTVSVIFNAIPDLTINNSVSLIISSGDSTNISFSSTLSGTTFTWTVNAPLEISGAIAGSGPGIVQKLNNSSVFEKTVTYFVTPTSPTGCSGISQSTNVIVITPPVTAADSLTLVDLYTNTGGANWINTTNWLTQPVYTWFGVEVSNGKIVSIILSNNNLTGTLPANLTSLDELVSLQLDRNNLSGIIPVTIIDFKALQDINLSNNNLIGAVPPLPPQVMDIKLNNNFLTSLNTVSDSLITIDISFNDLVDLGNLTGKNVTTLKVEQNNLTFEDLEPNMSIPTFTYSPQDSVETKDAVLLNTGADYDLVSKVGGSVNVYQWFKNNTLIAGAVTDSLSFKNISIDDDASYHYEVTSSLIPGLTLFRELFELKVSSLKRDSISLHALYNLTSGDNWINNSNWVKTPLATGNWFGITITNNRITAIDLPGNNLNGEVPDLLADIQNLQTINIGNNSINLLPDLTALTALTSLDVSGNKLDFGSLEYNISIAGINYINQAVIGTSSTVELPAGEPYLLSVDIDGVNNVYQWKRNEANVVDANLNTYEIGAISRSNMGRYFCEITNSTVPGLILSTAVDTIYAVGSIEGTVLASTATPASSGILRLLRVVSDGAYDTTRIESINGDGTYLLSNVILDDYQLVVQADTIENPGALPTYYKNTIFWEEADTINLEGQLNNIDFLSQYVPSETPTGRGVIKGIIVEDDGSSSGGRVQGSKRVAGAGVSVRRVETTGRGLEGEEILTLIAYHYTNEEGEFEFTNLNVGEYRLNIQYPGYPMDENSFVTIPIGGGTFESEKTVEAVVEEGKIHVRELIITRVWEPENYQVDAYPNPASSIINFNFQNSSGGRVVEFYDMMGRKIMKADLEKMKQVIDVRMLGNGSYLIKVSENGILVKTMHLMID